MITATVLTKNSQKTLQSTLDSLSVFPEVIVLDSGSTDQTLTIAKRYPNVSVHTSPFLGFGPMHNYATKLASNDWILSVDSDEVVSKALASEIMSLDLGTLKVYQIPRHNYFNGKWIKWCGGWHPDKIVRLYNRKETAFSDDLVHECVLTDKVDVIPLSSPLEHTPFQEIGDFIDKIQHYSSLFADQHAGRDVSLFQAVTHGFHAFVKSYLFKRGFMGGKEGFVISVYNGHCAYYKYLKLAMQSARHPD